MPVTLRDLRISVSFADRSRSSLTANVCRGPLEGRPLPLEKFSTEPSMTGLLRSRIAYFMHDRADVNSFPDKPAFSEAKIVFDLGRVGWRAEARSPSALKMLRNGYATATRQAELERVADWAQNRVGLTTGRHPPPSRASCWPFRLLALSPLMEGRRACCGRCSRGVRPRRR